MSDSRGKLSVRIRNAGTAAAYRSPYNSGMPHPAFTHKTSVVVIASAVTASETRISGRPSSARHNDGNTTASTAAGNSLSASTSLKTALYSATDSVPLQY